MTIRDQIGALERLAAVDASLSELGTELAVGREALAGKREQLAGLTDKVAQHQRSLEEMERLRAEFMQDIRQMSHQIERSREKLGRCRSEREANAVQRELEELRKLYRDRETEVEKLVGLAEQARAEMDRVALEQSAVESELGASEGASTNRIAELEQAVEQAEAKRKEAITAVPVVLFRRYELIRKRRGTALAHTTDGKCSACNIVLPPMAFHQLRRGTELSQCPSCQRILYFKEPAPESAEPPADSPASPP
ncbi:MAG: hypothetical protein IT376_07890 [Polyangiaceae bacterium]|nr:hypothetical protein [Polyangiaceae bacterium]